MRFARWHTRLPGLGAALILLCSGTAWADAMRCSGQHQTCSAACARLGDANANRVCLTTCTRQRANCLRTGCWEENGRTYCGLLKQ